MDQAVSPILSIFKNSKKLKQTDEFGCFPNFGKFETFFGYFGYSDTELGKFGSGVLAILATVNSRLLPAGTNIFDISE